MAYQVRVDTVARVRHPLLDLAGETRVTGEAANLAFVLTDPAGNASGLTVSAVEQGTTGLYDVSFTPDATGVWLLDVVEPADTAGRTVQYAIDALETSPVLPAGAELLTSLARVKRQLWPDSDPAQPTAYDSLLTLIISEVSADVSAARGAAIVETAFAYYFDGNDKDMLPLHEGPLVSVSAVYEVEYDDDGAGGRQVTETAFDPYKYLPRGERAQGYKGFGWLERRDGGVWTAGKQNWKVEFTAGWAAVPDPIIALATNLVVGEFSTRDTQGFKSTALGDFRVTVADPQTVAKRVSSALGPFMEYGI